MLVTACVPQNRVNASCLWREKPDALGAPGTQMRRAHLAADVRLAQELGVRHADSAIGRPPPDMRAWQGAERQCTAAALDAAVRLHKRDGITRVELDALRGSRDWWFDLLAIFLPVGFLFAAVSRYVARRVVEGSDGELGLPTVQLAFLTPAVSVFAFVATQMWSWRAEVLRLHNDHISYRAFQLPTSYHP